MPRRNNHPPHSHYALHNSCATKRSFRHEREALAAAEHQMLIHPQLELRVYQCNDCGKWHLTRRVSL